MNEAPSSGSVSVQPGKGFALETAYSFTALNWVDEDLPLAYRFGTVPVHKDGSLDLAMAAPFGDGRSAATYSGVTLSAGLNYTNFSVGCFAEVIDSYGAEGSGTTTVRVLIKPLSIAALRNISEAKAQEALESHNSDAAKQILKATLDSMDTTSDSEAAEGRRRRRLLDSSDGESAGLLASVLSNLWATYDITPVTQSDVASLLGALVGVVDEPDLCTDAIAAGSLNFLISVRKLPDSLMNESPSGPRLKEQGAKFCAT